MGDIKRYIRNVLEESRLIKGSEKDEASHYKYIVCPNCGHYHGTGCFGDVAYEDGTTTLQCHGCGKGFTLWPWPCAPVISPVVPLNAKGDRLVLLFGRRI